MAFNELEAKCIEKAMSAFMARRRPSPEIRPDLDLGYRVSAQSVEIFEIRPAWRGAPGEVTEQPVAKTTYVRTQRLWRVFWMRADLRWHVYPPAPTVDTFDTFLSHVERDEHACFFG
jgi:hypothetical protein